MCTYATSPWAFALIHNSYSGLHFRDTNSDKMTTSTDSFLIFGSRVREATTVAVYFALV